MFNYGKKQTLTPRQASEYIAGILKSNNLSGYAVICDDGSARFAMNMSNASVFKNRNDILRLEAFGVAKQRIEQDISRLKSLLKTGTQMTEYIKQMINMANNIATPATTNNWQDEPDVEAIKEYVN